MKRILIISGVLMLAVAAVSGWQLWAAQPSRADNADFQSTFVVEPDTIVSSVKATGRLEAQSDVALGFEVNGTVAEVLVERGQVVQAGDPLARLNADELQLQLAQTEANLAQLLAGSRAEDIAAAEASLRNAQANYDKVAAGARDEDIAAAEAALRGAQANYNELANGLDDNEITVAAANLRNAEVALQSAQREYDKVAYADEIGETPQAAELEKATIAYESAAANYRLTVEGASDEQLAAGWAQVEQAQAQLDKLRNGSTAEELAMARAQVEQAQAQFNKLKNGPTPEELAVAQNQVDQARFRLSQTVLAAPVDGVITEVNISASERAGTTPVISLADLSALHIDLPVDEIDLPAVRVGQPATITLDAMTDTPFNGWITTIAPVPIASAGGGTSYEVTVTLNAQNGQTKVGMTANVDIETARRENVLVIPAGLVQVDQATGQTYVTRQLASGETERIDLQLGVRNGGNLEVVSGLQAGDEVMAPLSAEQQATEASGDLFSGMRDTMHSMRDAMP